MPQCPDGTPLDPRDNGHGLPFRYRWFGLPSMWFTSEEAYNDMRLWVQYSRQDKTDILPKLYPEEMALLALNPDGASYLRKTLASAKLFGRSTWDFLTRDRET